MHVVSPRIFQKTAVPAARAERRPGWNVTTALSEGPESQARPRADHEGAPPGVGLDGVLQAPFVHRAHDRFSVRRRASACAARCPWPKRTSLRTSPCLPSPRARVGAVFLVSPRVQRISSQNGFAPQNRRQTISVFHRSSMTSRVASSGDQGCWTDRPADARRAPAPTTFVREWTAHQRLPGQDHDAGFTGSVSARRRRPHRRGGSRRRATPAGLSPAGTSSSARSRLAIADEGSGAERRLPWARPEPSLSCV